LKRYTVEALQRYRLACWNRCNLVTLQRFNVQLSLHDLERGALTVARSGAGQKRADRLDRLAVAPNDPADIGLAKLHAKDRRLSRWDFGKHHLIGKLDELANDEFEELFHESENYRPYAAAASLLKGTQASCLCGKRISDPLPQIQRAASPLAAQTASLCSYSFP
jgi:hypothetical protein